MKNKEIMADDNFYVTKILYEMTKSSVMKYDKKTVYLGLMNSKEDLEIIDQLIKEDGDIIGYKIIAPYQSDTPEEDLLEIEFFKKE